MMRLDSYLDYVRKLPEKEVLNIIEEVYNSSVREIILKEADDLCYDRKLCKEHGFSYCNITNWDYWTIAAAIYLQKQQSKRQPQEASTR